MKNLALQTLVLALLLGAFACTRGENTDTSVNRPGAVTSSEDEKRAIDPQTGVPVDAPRGTTATGAFDDGRFGGADSTAKSEGGGQTEPHFDNKDKDTRPAE